MRCISLCQSTHHPARAPALDLDSGTPSYADIEVYTDGSRIDGGVAAGVAIYQDGPLQVGESYKLSPWASVYQAELVAIVKGLELLNACNVDAAEEVRFYTDSMSSLKALSNSGSLDPLVSPRRDNW